MRKDKDEAEYAPTTRTYPVTCESCIHSRRCFMSGEYCSKQLNIYQERKKLHDGKKINAFVVMNFSDMSDVVYKWKLRDFVKSLSSQLYINKASGTVICATKNPGDEWDQVVEINVLRADSNPASNYVVCNRVCQQMQIADLIIVDVTVENTNVFYEFGMAVALDKLILPICYNDSFFRHKPPSNNREELDLDEGWEDESGANGHNFMLEKHIDCFSWRRRLFEYYGIRYRNKYSKVHYFPYNIATKEKDFTDIHYSRFPYHQEFEIPCTSSNSPKQKIGQVIYDTLRTSYNSHKGSLNTLVIYTMEGFQNGDEAGECIINFYEHMTAQVKKMRCFSGDRVITLFQGNDVNEENKDSKEKEYLPYSIGDLIHIGMNQATYVAQRDKIVASDYLHSYGRPIQGSVRNEIIISVKKHIGNRSVMIPLLRPIYVEQVRNGLQQDIFRTDTPGGLENYFCFFHVMLRTLQYANEIVVDISNNCIEALFWLGMAHGADIHAITVRYDRSGQAVPHHTDSSDKRERKIFDVAGLWTAVLKTHDTEGFYRQLALAQTSIEQHSKLMLKNADHYEEELLDRMREDRYSEKAKGKIETLLDIKRKEELLELESYYRNRFWNHLIYQNHLHLYIPQSSDVERQHRLSVAKWDVDAMSAVSHYLTKRKVISESYIKAIGGSTHPQKSSNFISFGAGAKPCVNVNEQFVSLAEYINEQFSNGGSSPAGVHVPTQPLDGKGKAERTVTCTGRREIRCRGFVQPNSENDRLIFGLLPGRLCYGSECAFSRESNTSGMAPYYKPFELIVGCPFPMKNGANPKHIQIGQLLLWRERQKCLDDHQHTSVKFQVSLVGSSGPATYALSSLLVDETQKSEIIDPNNENKDEHSQLLCQMQYAIRQNFMQRYMATLGDFSINGNVIDSVSMYLSTVLYRYFFPFLSVEDEHCLCHGLTAYLTAMGKENDSEFNIQIRENVVRKLRDLLESFVCVEAMYAVEVEVQGSQTDNRIIRSISPVDQEENQDGNIRCFYFN